jgi:hypothetical protein
MKLQFETRNVQNDRGFQKITFIAKKEDNPHIENFIPNVKLQLFLPGLDSLTISNSLMASIVLNITNSDILGYLDVTKNYMIEITEVVPPGESTPDPNPGGPDPNPIVDPVYTPPPIKP